MSTTYRIDDKTQTILDRKKQAFSSVQTVANTLNQLRRANLFKASQARK